MNHDIRLSPIRLIDQNNEQVGVVETAVALRMAQEAGLDLVEIQPDVRPPVCKIMDYGKFRFEMSKKERSARSATKQAEMKEVRLGRSQKIFEHDVEIRVEQARRFLMDGHKVQMVQQFRGREIVHKETAFKRFEEIVKELADISKVEVPPKLFGKRMSLILAPDKVKIEAIKRREEKERKAAAKASGAAEPKSEAPSEEGPEPEPSDSNEPAANAKA